MKKKKENTITDFGEHIGGSRKELCARVANFDISDFSETEKRSLVKKSNLIKLDYEKIKEEKGVEVAYLSKLICNAIPATVSTNYEGYVEMVKAIKKSLDELTSIESKQILDLFVENGLMEKSGSYYSCSMGCIGYGIIDRKMTKALRTSPYEIKRQIRNKQFLWTNREKAEARYIVVSPEKIEKSFDSYRQKERITIRDNYSVISFWPDNASEFKEGCAILREADNYKEIKIFNSLEEAEAAKEKAVNELIAIMEKAGPRKKTSKKVKWTPPHLENIVRKGKEERTKEIEGSDYLEEFKFRGGEFGNWLNDNERQIVLNYGYEALEDLADALEVSPEKVSLGNKLAIAFGARGVGNAMAHFEPLKNVINLTKLKGAGSLAHEWGHAFDYYIANKHDMKCDLASENWRAPESLRNVIKAMKHKKDGTVTSFYKKSKEMDESYSKSGHGYWQSNCEMFARLFAVYIKDKLRDKGFRSDYLCGHAESTGAIPNAEEKKELYPLMDALLNEELKTENV